MGFYGSRKSFAFSWILFELVRILSFLNEVYLSDLMVEAIKVEPLKKAEPVQEEEKKFLEFKDWLNVDLRVGLIETVEDIVRKDKLYKLLVDFASEKRLIVAGLKLYYTKEELVGKKAIFVFNLAPAKLGGIESNGMILAARNSEGKYKVFFADDSVAQGTKLE